MPAREAAIPLLDLKRQYAEWGGELEAAALRVLRSGRYVLGPELAAFEREAAAFLGSGHAVGVSSGTDALLCTLMALGVGPGDEVLVPSYTFFATAGSVARLGARPVFVDVGDESLCLDPALVGAALTRRTKACIAVHLFGLPADTPALRAILDPRGVPLVEDAAQAIGASLPGSHAPAGRAGTLGRAACFSFFPSKNLGACGDGGLVTTDDGELAARLRRLRNHGQASAYEHPEVGGNFRLDELQAALLRVKLRRLPALNDARRERAARWRELLAAAELGGRLRCPPEREGQVYHQFVVRVADGARDAALGALDDAGIGCAVYYRLPLHRQPCFAPNDASCPVSERASAECLALPIFPELREDEQRRAVAVLAGCLRAR